jgi:ribose transport system substrate-binding protein
VIGTIGASLSTSPAADQATNDQIINAAGKTNDKSFCGTKPIVLGIHDGFGINGWSKSSMAAVRSEAAKCPNVKQIVRIGQGDLQKSIADVNGMVAQGINALVIIPDFGKPLERIMSLTLTMMLRRPDGRSERGWPRRFTRRATSSISEDLPAIR